MVALAVCDGKRPWLLVLHFVVARWPCATPVFLLATSWRVCVAWQPLPLQHHFCHTHTTVTVIGGTAKQLLGSSTDWCATTIVTPHTRGATSTHTHGWQSGVVWPMCCDCCVHQHLHGHFTLPHHLCVSPHQPSVCHHPFHHPFAFLSHTPFWCVCGIVKWHSRSLCGC